jgi:hypothetical protein
LVDSADAHHVITSSTSAAGGRLIKAIVVYKLKRIVDDISLDVRIATAKADRVGAEPFSDARVKPAIEMVRQTSCGIGPAASESECQVD